MKAPKALQAFYGARHEHEHERVQARANTAKAHISPGERPQEVFTPQSVIRMLLSAWDNIALDPCGHPDAVVPADEIWTGYRVDTGRRGKNGPIHAWDGPGLRNPWPDRTYWNPPYCDLEAWLEHALKQPGRWLGLFPARTHRVWCREFLRQVDGICWLNPLTFEGYASASPDRLALAYRGPDVQSLVRATPATLGEWTGPLKLL